jgi:hypothetical protein
MSDDGIMPIRHVVPRGVREYIVMCFLHLVGRPGRQFPYCMRKKMWVILYGIPWGASKAFGTRLVIHYALGHSLRAWSFTTRLVIHYALGHSVRQGRPRTRMARPKRPGA